MFHKPEKFNPAREFVANGQMTYGGKQLVSGDPFDKSKVNVRRLRLLYEQRRVRYANGHADIADVTVVEAANGKTIDDLQKIISTPPERIEPEQPLPPPVDTAVIPVSEERKRVRAIAIPDVWRDLPWMKPVEKGGPTLKNLATQFADTLGRSVVTKADAISAVEAELMLRGKGA